jgi:propanol-preferring alcohol dehydrogenase
LRKAAVTKVDGTHVTTSFEEVPVPKLKQGEILVKINWSGLRFNDLGLMRNYWPVTPSAALYEKAARGISGHEGVGNVVAVAEDIAREDLWSIGDHRWDQMGSERLS